MKSMKPEPNRNKKREQNVISFSYRGLRVKNLGFGLRVLQLERVIEV